MQILIPRYASITLDPFPLKPLNHCSTQGAISKHMDEHPNLKFKSPVNLKTYIDTFQDHPAVYQSTYEAVL